MLFVQIIEEILTLIQARIRLAGSTILLTSITMDVRKTGAVITIESGFGTIADAIVLTWLENIAECTRNVTLCSNAGDILTGRCHERRRHLVF